MTQSDPPVETTGNAAPGWFTGKLAVVTVNAPHVRVAVVMPGHVGTDILVNTRRAHDQPGPEDLGDAQLAEARARLTDAGLLAGDASDDQVRQRLAQLESGWRDNAPVSAAQTAAIILDAVRSGVWRILVGEDARVIDAAVRSKPEATYDYAELFSAMTRAPAAGTPER